MSDNTIVKINSKSWQCAHYPDGGGKAVDLSSIYTVPLPAFPPYNGLLMDAIYDTSFTAAIDTSFFAFDADIMWIRGSGYVSGVSPRIKTNGISFTGQYRYMLIVNKDESSGVSVGDTAIITPQTRKWSVGDTLACSFRGHDYTYLINSYQVFGSILYTGVFSVNGGQEVVGEMPQSALIEMGATLSTPSPPVAFDMNSLISMMMVVMMMGMMMPMMEKM